MNLKNYAFCFLVFSCLFLVNQSVFARQSTGTVSGIEVEGFFPLVGDEAAPLVVDVSAEKSLITAVENFQHDVQTVTGKAPEIVKRAALKDQSRVVLIGTVGESPLLEALEQSGKLDFSAVRGKWEVFHRQVIQRPFPGVEEALVIAGSDPRGTVFGVYDLSEQIGVSPWIWWADVPVKGQETLYVAPAPLASEEPSVKYRGIFLNDEDWGLQPWAAKTFEPETGDIGPKTYAKIFELLLRLKANFIWPAMHPSTKAFFHYPGNAEMAKNYGIVIGTSHAEPMLRNNVDEWHHDSFGDFNYTTNRERVYDYWDERVAESKDIAAVYTVGMRGVHDSGMEGAGSTEEAANMLENIIQDQRGMLEKHKGGDAADVPQAFTAYKEVLGIYDAGMDLPTDITLVWPDDNYGYIRRLSDASERKRVGGAGVYYHASYWGRPHDYLWLSSTHPALIREEMMKAYQLEAKNIWVLNVGDIKPSEYNIQLFLDMAYDAPAFKQPEHIQEHMKEWYREIFGAHGAAIGKAMWRYYQLAFERKPEFMGWSQTEPTTPIHESAYSPFLAGDEVDKRLQAYQDLVSALEQIKPGIEAEQFSAFYQLAYYPIKGASLMNQKFLYRQKALDYQQEGRLSAADYAKKVHEAYDDIVKETAFYNQQLADGKWNHMMDHAPRRLPVYQEPEMAMKDLSAGIPSVQVSMERGGIAEGKLPVFNNLTKREHFFDLYLSGEKTASWEVVAKPDYVLLDHSSGVLSPSGQKEERIWVKVDWANVPFSTAPLNEEISIQVDGKTITVPVELTNFQEVGSNLFVADNGQVVIYAENHSQRKANGKQNWERVDGLGHSGAVMQAAGLKLPSVEKDFGSQASLTYEFYLDKAVEEASVAIMALPTHPVTIENGVKVGVSVNGGPIQLLDFQTHGRSEEWKQNVLRNRAVKTAKGISLKNGRNTLEVFWVDPGVLLDVIKIKVHPELEEGYGLLPETKP